MATAILASTASAMNFRALDPFNSNDKVPSDIVKYCYGDIGQLDASTIEKRHSFPP